jgi:hypothetical protein
MNSWAFAIRAAASTCSSDTSSPNPMLPRMVSSKRKTSWPTKATSPASADRAKDRRSRPSMWISPDTGSHNLASSVTIVDFPEPVGPTTATVVSGLMSMWTSSSTNSSGTYPNETSIEVTPAPPPELVGSRAPYPTSSSMSSTAATRR